MRLLKQSTARDIVVFMTDSSDHVSGKTGLTLTITASKNAAAFASISPTVTELATGWYKLALTASHTDTLGDLALHITATGADPTDTLMQVVALLPGEAVTLQADQAVNVTKWAGAATATDDIALKSSLAKGTDITGFNDLDAAGVRSAVGLASANLDTQLSAIDDYIDSEIGTLQTTATAIKAKTDNLPASPAATGDIPSAATIATQVLTSAQSTPIHADVRKVNNTTIAGAGTELDPWGP